MKDKLLKEYKELDYKFNLNEDSDYKYLVNFSQTKELPIHNWFYFVEGYSPKLVTKLFKYLKISETSTLLDPFSGSGTTLLTSKMHNMNSVGFEINPFSAFMIKVKTQNYSQQDIDFLSNWEYSKNVVVTKGYENYELRIIRNLFDDNNLNQIESLKSEISLIGNKKVQNIAKMTLLSILPEISNYRKGGNGLKKKTKKPEDINVFSLFQDKLEIITKDITTKMGKEPTIYNDTCLNMDKYDISNIDISIFSPPYANCFDPFEVYKTELWIGDFVKDYETLREKRKRALTSNLNANVKKEIDTRHRTKLLEQILNFLESETLWDKRIPKMLDTYFYDMYIVLNSIYKVTRQGGYAVIVVGNSAYAGLSIPTDLLLAQIGERVGFSVVEIIEARKNETSSQQYKKIGQHIQYLRESLIILKK